MLTILVFQKQLWKEDTEKALEMVQKQGVKVYHPDKTGFREKEKPMHESYEGTEVGELIAEIDKVQ